MILTVTPNPALDITYRLRALIPGEVHRVSEVVTRAGGKGVNVARVLRQLDEPCAVLGFGGGSVGARLAAELADDGVDVRLVEVLPDLRRTLVVHTEDGATTSLWEPGLAPADPAAAGKALLTAVLDRLSRARAVTVSGSLPAGVDPALPARIARASAERGVPVVLDLDGDALRAAADAGGAVLMPNTDELEALTGERPASPAEVAALATELVCPTRSGRRPSAAVVATLGAQGLVAVSAAGAVHARPPVRVRGNPTGAGDAACAAVARALAGAGSAGALDLRKLAAETVAVSAASVLRPVAGEIDLAAYRRWIPQIVVEDLCP